MLYCLFFRMPKFTKAFEIGIHYGLLVEEWEKLANSYSSFNVLEKNFIQTKMNMLNHLVRHTNYHSNKGLKRLKREIEAVDDYIIHSSQQSRVLKDLSHLPNLTTPQ